jgi:L-fuconolactonase
MIIDTHVHVWDLDKAKYPWLEGDTSLLNQTWKIEQLEEERKKTGITAGVLVQAAGNLEDTENMLQVAEATEWIKGVVGWLPLQQSEIAQDLIEKKYLGHPYLKGVRHQVHDEQDPKWLLQAEVIDSLTILAENDIPFDVVAVLPEQIETAIIVSKLVPGLKMVFDHLGQPPISTKEKFGRWGELMKEAAQHKNFYAKISGLGTASKNFENWKADDLLPYIEFVLRQFGADRCFCGGDWPVSVLAGTYSQIWEAYKDILGSLLNKEEREKVLSDNAVRFYGLDVKP